MGGQACVFYGAAEFSRDTDIILMAAQDNYRRLDEALADLDAECIAVPPFSPAYLKKGHAVHFRCRHPEAQGMRIDVMTTLRGVRPFPELWRDRTVLETDAGAVYDLMSLPDLVAAKKTQRDKDWPMIRRLIEAHYLQERSAHTDEQVDFWLRECRTVSLLQELGARFPRRARDLAAARPLLSFLDGDSEDTLIEALKDEEEAERSRDREYWAPLIRELEALRHDRRDKRTR